QLLLRRFRRQSHYPCPPPRHRPTSPGTGETHPLLRMPSSPAPAGNSLAALVLLLWIIGSALSSSAAELPLHPVAAPDTCSLHPALETSLFAREPDVIDPVALTFDGEGRMFVGEMRDYPYGFGPDRRPGGVIRLLEDTDGDGRADRSVVFAEGLSFPTSIAAW